MMVCLFSLPVLAQNSMTILFGSRYICFGLDFIPQNHPLYTASFEIPAGNFSFGPYFVPGHGYGEMGCYIGYNIPISKVANVTLAAVPVVWQYEGDGFKMAIIGSGKINFNFPLNPSFVIHYAHVPDNPVSNGFCFTVGIRVSPFKIFDLSGSIAYNTGMFIPDGVRGFNGLLEASKTLKISEKVSVRGFFQYWINESQLNENEPVFGISLTNIF